MYHDPRMQTQYSNYIPTSDTPQLEYSLIFSSIGCPHSKQIIDLLKELDVTVNLDVYDIQHFLKTGQEIPSYVDGTPQLIISKQNQMSSGGQISQILLGFKQISNWINNHLKKPNHSISRTGSGKTNNTNSGGNYVSIDKSHGNCKFAPPKVTDFDEYGRPIADASIFQIPTEDRGSKGNIDMGRIESERNQLDKQFGMAPGPSNGPPPTQAPRQSMNPTPTPGRRIEPAGQGRRTIQPAGGGGGKYAPVGK